MPDSFFGDYQNQLDEISIAKEFFGKIIRLRTNSWSPLMGASACAYLAVLNSFEKQVHCDQILCERRDIAAAVALSREGLEILKKPLSMRKLEVCDRQFLERHIATMRHRIGICLQLLGEREEAEGYLEHALQYYEVAAKGEMEYAIKGALCYAANALHYLGRPDPLHEQSCSGDDDGDVFSRCNRFVVDVEGLVRERASSPAAKGASTENDLEELECDYGGGTWKENADDEAWAVRLEGWEAQGGGRGEDIYRGRHNGRRDFSEELPSVSGGGEDGRGGESGGKYDEGGGYERLRVKILKKPKPQLIKPKNP